VRTPKSHLILNPVWCQGDAVVQRHVADDIAQVCAACSRRRRTRAGAEHIYDLGEMNDYEKEGLKEAIAALKGSIDKGIEFANNKV